MYEHHLFVFRTSHRILFSWMGRSWDDAEDAFVENMGCSPYEVPGIKVEMDGEEYGRS